MSYNANVEAQSDPEGNLFGQAIPRVPAVQKIHTHYAVQTARDAKPISPLHRTRFRDKLQEMGKTAKQLIQKAAGFSDENPPRCLLTNVLGPQYCHVVPRATEEELVCAWFVRSRL